MSEKVRFHNMTKPIKFRRLKILRQYIVLWCRAVRERIKYLFNYILYKLNILKRYSYRDKSVQVLSLPHQVLVQRVKSNNVSGNIVMTLLLENNIDVDYFYRERKGKKKITMYMKDQDETRLFTESHLTNIHLKVDKWYSVDSLPVFKIAFYEDKVKPFDPSEPLKSVDYKTKNYNVGILKTATHRNLIGTNMKPEDISEPMLHYYYNFSVGEFKKYLDSLTLNDLLV